MVYAGGLVWIFRIVAAFSYSEVLPWKRRQNMRKRGLKSFKIGVLERIK
jgi:hypothetical protein